MLSQSDENSADGNVGDDNDQFSGTSSEHQRSGGEVRDTYVICEYNKGNVRDFSLQPSEARLSFTEHLVFDFTKTIWYSRMEKVLFASHTNHEQMARNSGQCGYHLYIANNVLKTVYCYKESGGLQTDTPVVINEVIPKIRVKEVHTQTQGWREVLVVGRRLYEDNYENSYLKNRFDDPYPARLNLLLTKSFGIYVEEGAKLVLLDKHYLCTNIRYHNNAVVTGGGFLVIVGELNIGIASEGVSLYSSAQVTRGEQTAEESQVYFLKPTNSQSLCWGLGVHSSGEWCLLIPDNGTYSIKNYQSEGLYEVLQKHSSKPWSRNVQHPRYD